MYNLQPVKKEIELVGFHNIYYFEFGKDFTHPPEQHDFWEMVYVDNGNIIAITDSIGTKLTQGQVIFHSPGEIHAHISDKKTPNNMLVISFTATGEIMDYFQKKIFEPSNTEKAILSMFIKEAKRALGKIPGEYKNKDDLNFENADFGSTQLLQCYFTEFLIQLARNEHASNQEILLNDVSRSITRNSIVELAIRFMHERVYSTLTLEELCSFSMCGKSSLSKIFKDNTGKSPMEYFSDLKLIKAKELLREENLSVSEIADKLNYTSIHSFSRAFKIGTGFSPLGYKKSIL